MQHFERIALDALIVDSNGLPLLTDRVLSRGPRNILAAGIPTSLERRLDDGTKIIISGRDALPAFDYSDKPVEVSAGPHRLHHFHFRHDGNPQGRHDPGQCGESFCRSDAVAVCNSADGSHGGHYGNHFRHFRVRPFLPPGSTARRFLLFLRRK